MYGAFAYGQLGYAQPAGVAVTLPPVSVGIIIAIDNVITDRIIRYPAITIRDIIGSQPNTGSLTFITSFPPTTGAAIKIGAGSFNPPALLFAGQIQQLQTTYESQPRHTFWPVDLIDHTFRLNKRRPFGAWVNTSATTIANAVVAAFAPGFTTAHVQPALPATSINFDGTKSVIECLNELATSIDGRVKIDYVGDVHLFLDAAPETEDVPDPVDNAHPPLNTPPMSFTTDLSQCRTRVYGKGLGQDITVEVAANDSIVPITDVSMFRAPAQAIVGTTPDSAHTQIVSYTGVFVATGGTIVGPGFTPAVAPGVTAAAGTGLSVGVYGYVVTFTTSGGETKPSPIGAVTTSAGLDAPTGAPTVVSVTGGAGVEPGDCRYATTFAIAGGGETTIGAASAWASPRTVAAPSSAIGSFTENAAASTNAGWKPGDSLSVYLAWVTATGPTNLSPANATPLTCTEATGPILIPPPSSAPSAANSTQPNNATGWAIGDVVYVGVTWLGNYSGETTVSPTSSPITIADNFPYTGTHGPSVINIAAIPTNPTYTRLLRIYVNRNGVWTGYTEYQPSTTAVTGLSGPQFGSGGASTPPPATNTATYVGGSGNAHALDIRQIPNPTDPAVTAKRVYLRNNTKATWVGYVETSAATTELVGVVAMTASSAPAGTAPPVGVVTVRDIPIGPANTTARKVYRWGPTYQAWLLWRTINGNADAGTLTDTTPSSSLTQVGPPTTNTAVLCQVALNPVPLGPSGVTGRKVYRTPCNGYAFYLAKTIGNNSSTDGGVDAVPDASLGAPVPTGDTSGLQPAGGQVGAGSTTMLTSGTTMFAPTGGWAKSGSQAIRYTGISGNTLTGIPTTGPGSVTVTIPYGAELIPVSALTGVSGLTQRVLPGASVHIWVQRDDLQAQYELGLLERDPFGQPTDGVREYTIVDTRRGYDSLIAVCDADLSRFARPIIGVTYSTRDLKTRAGKTVTINLTDGGHPWGLSGDFLIQDVTVSVDPAPDLLPRFTVHATSAKFSFVDLLQRVLLAG